MFFRNLRLTSSTVKIKRNIWMDFGTTVTKTTQTVPHFLYLDFLLLTLCSLFVVHTAGSVLLFSCISFLDRVIIRVITDNSSVCSYREVFFVCLLLPFLSSHFLASYDRRQLILSQVLLEVLLKERGLPLLH
ncbi:hypothetical protein AMECASPLE_019259 [Ameca splendens]|uniref:Uncharacterized protein n=1 Tax=Ameca splendens TaxID=208324 RepID=A0ABV0ZNK8_9TELE